MLILRLLLATLAHATLPGPPEMMCQNDDFTFRSCYSATEEQCLEWAGKAFSHCMHRIPLLGLNPGEWGLALGHCTERVFHEEHKASFSSDPLCQENLALRQKGYAEDDKLHRFPDPPSALALVLPTLFAALAVFGYLFWRARKKLSLGQGVLAWFLFVFVACATEAALHMLLPGLFRGIGDNPNQIAGFLIALLLSVLLSPALWIGFWLWRKRTQIK